MHLQFEAERIYVRTADRGVDVIDYIADRSGHGRLLSDIGVKHRQKPSAPRDKFKLTD